MEISGARFVRIAALILAASLMWGCEGDDGATGPAGQTGQQGEQGDKGDKGDTGDPAPVPSALDAAVAEANVESCIVCHGGVAAQHTEGYDRYVDESKLTMTFNSFTAVADGAGTYTVTLDFSISENIGGIVVPYEDVAKLPSFGNPNQIRFYAVQYESAAGEYRTGQVNAQGGGSAASLSAANVVGGAAAGNYLLTQTGFPFDPTNPVAPFDGAQVYGYIAARPLFEHETGESSEFPAGTHVHLYDDVSNAALAWGTALAADASAYVSAANVGGCEKCHGKPYRKHGYRDPLVAGLPEFGSCKSCHFDDRNGGYEDWKYMVDDPVNWATAGLTELEVETKYAYKAKLMNDVHMAHAMEFPYPQSMSNCATCHGPLFDAAGVEIPGTDKLAVALDNSNFKGETCKSCHPVEGDADYNQGNRAPPLAAVWEEQGVLSLHGSLNLDTADCTLCHGAGNIAPAFNELHIGYDIRIANAAGQRYRDLYAASIDAITRDGDLLTIEFSANNADIVPEVLVSFYAWDSKQYLIPSHTRDGSLLCTGRGGSAAGCDIEYTPGAGNNPLFTDDPASVPGDWKVTLDMGAFAAEYTDAIPTLIANGDVRRAEITVTPTLTLPVTIGRRDPVNDRVVLDAVGATFDLGTGLRVPDYFKGGNAVVSTDKCDVCHDSLASSFHDGSGRGGGGTQVCKNCHNPTFSGSHVEMASRSIDNYVHAIHSFQGFDVADVFNFDPPGAAPPIPNFDPVLAKRYDQHIKHVFPRFTIRNCEACHLAPEETTDKETIVYGVPNQAESIPGLQREADEPLTWYTMVDPDPSSNTNIPETIAVEVPEGRKIKGPTSRYVTGPASRACGGCHRAAHIKADDPVALSAFNTKMKANGTYVDANAEGIADENEVLFGIIDKIMSMFE